LRLAKIEISVYDAAHALVLRRALNTDAFAPSIGVVGNQILAPGQSLDVFNPFPEFEAQVPLKQLEYSFDRGRTGTSPGQTLDYAIYVTSKSAL
jgi:hypothetical protein